jgi:hypothetical protein
LDRLLTVAARGIGKAVYEVAPSVDDLLGRAKVSPSEIESSLGFSVCSDDGVVASQRLIYACMLHLAVSEYVRKGKVILSEISDHLVGLGVDMDEKLLEEVLVGHEERGKKRTFYQAVPQRNRLFSVVSPGKEDICAGKYHRVLRFATEENYRELLAKEFFMFNEDAEVLFQAYSPYLIKLQQVSYNTGFRGEFKHDFNGCVQMVMNELVSKVGVVSKRVVHQGIVTDYLNLFEFQRELNALLGAAGEQGKFSLPDAVLIYERYSGDEVGLSALRAKLDAAEMDIFGFIDALNDEVRDSPVREGCFLALRVPQEIGFMGDSPVIRSLISPEYLLARPFAH